MADQSSDAGSTVSSLKRSSHSEHLRPPRRESVAPHSDSLSNPHRRRTSRLSIVGGPRMDVFRRLSVASGTDISFDGAPKETKRQNTYRLGPEEQEKFNRSATERLITDTLKSYLNGETYDHFKCVGFAKSLSELIKARVRDEMSPQMYRNGIMTRYKIVCHVIVGQDSKQGLQCASRCLLNTDMDGFASASYCAQGLFAVATVYALYTD